MIKKAVNIFLKLPFLLGIIALSGVICLETFNLLVEQKKADNQKEKIHQEYYAHEKEVYTIINKELESKLNFILEWYSQAGMEIIPEIYKESISEFGYVLFDLVMVDGRYIYDSTTGELYEGENYGANYARAIGIPLKGSTEIRIIHSTRVSKSGKYGWEEMSLYEVFDEPKVNLLRSTNGELAIRISARKDGTEIYYASIEGLAEQKKDAVDEELKQYIDEILPHYIIYGIAYALLWILEVLKCRNKVQGKEMRSFIERLYTEISIIGVATSVIGIVMAFNSFGDTLNYGEEVQYSAIALWTAQIVTLIFAIAYFFITLIIRKLYRGRFFADMLIVRVIKKLIRTVRETYGIENYSSTKDVERLFIKKVIMDIFVTILMLVYVITFVIKVNRTGFIFTKISEVIVLVVVSLAFVFYVYKSIGEYKYIRTFNSVSKNIDYLYQGMYELVDNNDNSKINSKLSNLSEGFEKSLAKQIEAEKLQIELITNVSHDLKTPLTSIISYVDLLSKEELPPVASDYVKILVDKSDRLKTMVSDVFDLAKASSGEEIELESLDGMILVNQVLSDMGDAIKDSGRDIKLKADVDVAPIRGNGQKLYRVFQNVIGNALKYSMPGTRIFVNTYMEGNEFVFTIKNVSEFEIDFTEEEILSRFVRGDKSRNSEGNGLGLSIAKSFTEQCGGSFAVKLDDDMFKIIIRLR